MAVVGKLPVTGCLLFGISSSPHCLAASALEIKPKLYGDREPFCSLSLSLHYLEVHPPGKGSSAAKWWWKCGLNGKEEKWGDLPSPHDDGQQNWQPEEAQRPHFPGGTQSGNVLCPRAHCLWQNWDLISAQSPLVSWRRPLTIPHDKYVWEAYSHRDVVPVAKASVRAKERDALFSNHFLPHSAQLPSLIQIPHPTGHFRLRWRI